jgi:hypothetical protein
MIYFLIIGFVFLLILIWLLYSSILLSVDTNTKEYFVSFGNQIKLQLFFDNSYPMLKAKIFFFEKIIDPLESNKKKKEKKKEKKEKKVKPKKRAINNKTEFAKYAYKQGLEIIKTFKIRNFQLNIDTNDFIVNSYLAGLFSCLNRRNLLLQANYNGDFLLKFAVENKIIRIVIVSIRSFFVLKKYFVKIN